MTEQTDSAERPSREQVAEGKRNNAVLYREQFQIFGDCRLAASAIAFCQEMITEEIAKSIESSVLCWLATVSKDGVPNVSPKEAFLHDGNGRVVVANIASPQTIRNIHQNKNVCLSFVNVFVQKGYKITGEARVLKEGDARFDDQHRKLTSLIGEAFRIISIIEIVPVMIDEIIAPSYRLFPESTENDRIKESLKAYSVEHYQNQAGQVGDAKRE